MATLYAAVIDSNGRLIADAEFLAAPAGYTSMLRWMRSKGKLTHVGVEGVDVLEVPRPDRRLRRQRGKSDPIDAEAAAPTVLAGKASGAPKLADRPIEAIRMLRVARIGAVKGRTAAVNTLRSVVVTAPSRCAPSCVGCPRPNWLLPAHVFGQSQPTSPIPSKQPNTRYDR